MKKIALLAITLMLMSATAVPALAQEASPAASQYEDPTFSAGEVIRTNITEVGDYYIRVEDPDGRGITPSKSAEVYVDEWTKILWQDGTQANFGDLRVGQYIELTFTGPLEECPPNAICTAQIASASKIVILEDTADDEDPEVPTPKTTNGETSVGGPDVLPDTGGIPLSIAGATALMVAGGLLARRLTR